jgi:hypothetical protein
MQEAGSSGEAVRHSEGLLARALEDQTARLPSGTFLWAAGACIAGALTLQLMDRRSTSLFVGQWAPTLLILGLYNKLVKVAGSDRTADRTAAAAVN